MFAVEFLLVKSLVNYAGVMKYDLNFEGIIASVRVGVCHLVVRPLLNAHQQRQQKNFRNLYLLQLKSLKCVARRHTQK